MLNSARYNLTEMRCKSRSLKFELNLRQMPTSFENWHSQLRSKVKHTGRPDRFGGKTERENRMATTMWFLIKGSFWFGLVLVLLSFFSGESSTSSQPALQFSDAFVAATGAYDYVTGMCGEKPEVCVKGAETMAAIGHRAREGARVAYELLDSRFGDDNAAKPTVAPNAPITPVAALAPSHAEAQAEAQERTAALNQPMPYRPPVDDGDESLSDTVTTGTIPLPTPRPAT